MGCWVLVAHRLLQQQLQVQVFAMIMTRERCLLVLEFFFCFFFDQGIGSRPAAWASRVEVVWASVCVSSVVGCCSCVIWCCNRVAFYASCMYPHLLCNVDVMISTLQKRLQYTLLSLVGPSSSFRIGSHIGLDKLSASTTKEIVTGSGNTLNIW